MKEDKEAAMLREEEDEFLKQDETQWDIFRDKDKFERKEEIL